MFYMFLYMQITALNSILGTAAIFNLALRHDVRKWERK